MIEVLKDFKKIDTKKDLQVRGLTFADFNALYDVLKKLYHGQAAEFVQESIKNYLLKFKIKIQNKNVGYLATVKKK